MKLSLIYIVKCTKN